MTETTTPAQDLAAVEQYLKFWNASTSGQRQRLAAETFSEDVAYHVPLGVMHGQKELIGFLGRFAQQLPTYAFVARSQPERHHDRARLQWELMVGNDSFATGTDVLEIDENGRIASVTGFLDRAPEGFDPHATT
ncbi:nuclear transport factor 2 family protein [Agromyces laixinhei]|uniref:nuclear transport factor 2 family protein n=1 Tax=Agromyces laixinhei TaxID=2585717 RepID=UPI0012EE74A3|nr:nuclear transport factor 2 family protein [Agromyces laixinhei]